jgi:hypothetical protein
MEPWSRRKISRKGRSSSLEKKYRPEKERRYRGRALPLRQGELLLLRLLSFHEDPVRNGHQGEEPEERPRTLSYRWILPPQLP